MADPTLYPYGVLQKTSGTDILRLVKLLPADVNQDAVDCEITEIELAQKLADQQEKKQTKYEALSWYWGTGPHNDKNILVHRDNLLHRLPISSSLHSALQALRHPTKARYLWIDAISINQNNIDERNHQVSMMERIFAFAESVCIWTGPSDEHTKNALDFIKNHIVKVWKFDLLTKPKQRDKDWADLKILLTRPWFSRRWIVQEIALARKAELYCGRDCVGWKDFSVAVSLFVEVESNTHQLSDMMQRSEPYNFISEYFGNVPALGAASLVDVTGNLFRTSADGERQALLSLEYLISKYSVFEATQPRDTIYSFLSIASDTVPHVSRDGPDLDSPDARLKAQTRLRLKSWFAQKSTSRPYNVDYRTPVVDVYKEFVLFAITQSMKSDKASALDIICRPWAPRYSLGSSRAGLNEVVHGTVRFIQGEEAMDMTGSQNLPSKIEPLPSWIADLEGAPFGMAEHESAGLRMERQSADPLVGLPRHGERNYRAAGTRSIDPQTFKIKHFKLKHEAAVAEPDERSFFSMFVEGFILDQIHTICGPAGGGSIPAGWLDHIGWDPQREIPDHFWRTLVADRGPLGRNPPLYYARACQLAWRKRTGRNPLDTQGMIRDERSSIIADTLRRIQAVVWNKCLMTTTRGSRGLVSEHAEPGDFICIFYGCSVPVLLRRHNKSPQDVEAEKQFNLDEAKQLVVAKLQGVQQKWKELVQKKKTANVQTQVENTSGENSRPPLSVAAAEQRSVSNSNPSLSTAEALTSNNETQLRGQNNMIVPPRLWCHLQLLWTFIAVAVALYSPEIRWASFVIGAHALSPLTACLACWDPTMSDVLARVGIGASNIDGLTLTWSSVALWLAWTLWWMQNDLLSASIILSAPLVCAWRPPMETKLELRPNEPLTEMKPMAGAFEADSLVPSEPAQQVSHEGLENSSGPQNENKSATTTTKTTEADPLKSITDHHTDKTPLCFYEVIGDVYLHGMMDGEAISWQNHQIHANTEYKEDAIQRTFELR